MELNKFIKTTLEQIVDGASTAQGEIKKRGGNVNPSHVSYQEAGKYHSYSSKPQDVVFDVALTSTGKSGSTEGVGVFFGAVNLGKKNEADKEDVTVTRVKFTVPLVLPPGDPLER